MEFKKESTNDKARLAAGVIIDKYLTDDAENYISISTNLVNEVIGDYERCCTRGEPIDICFFDKSTRKIEKDLIRYVEEFRSMS